MTRTRRPCPCEASPALDGEAARAGAVAAYLTARAKALTDVPSLPTPPERAPGHRPPATEGAASWGSDRLTTEQRSAVVSTWGTPAADRHQT